MIQDPEPAHEVRTDFVAELYWLGYSEDEVVEIIRKLNWKDFDEKLTRYHVHKIFEKGLLPMSCSKLRNFVKCVKCGWFYYWTAREGLGATPVPGRTREGSRPNSNEGRNNAVSGEAMMTLDKFLLEEKFSLPRKIKGGWWFEVWEYE